MGTLVGGVGKPRNEAVVEVVRADDRGASALTCSPDIMDGGWLLEDLLVDAVLFISRRGAVEDCLVDFVLIIEVWGDDSSIIDRFRECGNGDVGVRAKGLENEVLREGFKVGDGSGGSSTSTIVVVICLSRLCVDCEKSCREYSVVEAEGDFARNDDISVVSSTDFSLLFPDQKSKGLLLPVLTVSLSSNWFMPNRDPVKER